MTKIVEWYEVPDRQEPIIAIEGPIAHHNQSCHVCSINPAVLDMKTGIFQPCWDCQKEGWKTIKLGRLLRRNK